MSGTFQYIIVPADSSRVVEVRTGNISGGLEKDELIQSAKKYFYNQSDVAKHLHALRNASTEERNQLAEKFRAEHAKTTKNLDKLSNDQILQLLETQHSSSSNSCEIIALTVATKGNGYEAVSIYISQYSENLKKNERASSLMTACGHALPQEEGREPGIFGDVFFGRAYDNEEEEWKRLDFAPEDLLPSSSWVQVARTEGGGGGQGKNGTAPSLSGSMKQFQQQQQLGGDTHANEEPPSEEEDLGYTWSQNDEEVEVKFKCDASVKAKDVKIKFARTNITAQVGDKVLLKGNTGGNVVVDESTFTLQDEGVGRELCIILGKGDVGRLWGMAVEP